MIVPRNRLLFWFAVVAVPFSLVAGVSPPAFGLACAAVGCLVVIAVVDALGARGALAGLRVELPPVVRMALQCEAKIELTIHHPTRPVRTLRLALPMPADFEQSREEMLVTLPGGSESSRLPWLCRPLHRGTFHLSSAAAEADSPLGFWGIRARVPVTSEIRVYPNLAQERKSLALLLRGAIGFHAQRQVGKGREFEKLREYVPGDGSEDIHWKATARKGRPITKVFQVERTQEVYLAIDSSRLSARQDALESFLQASLLVGLAAEQQGDLFGLITFSDRVEKFVRARNGRAHYDVCREAIHALEPKPVNPDFDDVCSFIRLRLRRRALIVFLTALDDPVLAENFVRASGLICRQHLLLVGMIPPPGAAPLFTDPDVADTDALYEELGGHLRWHNLEELGGVLQRRGVTFFMLDGQQTGHQLVSRYLSVKRRQLV